ncbi:MAG: hypothetical protein JXX14_12115 [Deltaproteobacteria bacterium]|nr:hypothetical protein [Deltaproteobacteria bacterium]
MTQTYEISKIDNGLIFYTRYEGQLSLKTMMESSYKRTADPDYRQTVFVVNDLLACDLSLFTPDHIRQISARVREVLVQRPYMVAIIIVKDELAYGLGRIWRGNTRPVSKDLHVVYSTEEAFKIVDDVRTERGI